MGRGVQLGFVGAGLMGQALMRAAARHPEAAIVALHQRSEARAREGLTAAGVSEVPYMARFDELLTNPAVDAVCLCGPNHTHGPHSIAALEAGKHVFCEKPVATTFADWERQLDLAARHPDLVTLVDYILHFDTFETKLAELVASGAFGTITQAQINYRHPVNVAGQKAWKLSRDTIGDAIGMGAVHSLYVLLRLMSMQSPPVSVYATSMPAQVRPFEVDPIWNIQITFANGACGLCLSNIDNSNHYDAYHNLHGTKGGLVFDSGLDRPQKVRFWSESETDSRWVYPLAPKRCAEEGTTPWPAETTTPDSGDVINHQTGAVINHFVRCVQDKQQSPLSFANTAIVAEIGWAAQMSAATGQPVALPLDRNKARAFFSESTAVA